MLDRAVVRCQTTVSAVLSQDDSSKRYVMLATEKDCMSTVMMLRAASGVLPQVQPPRTLI